MARPVIYGPDGEPVSNPPGCGFIPAQNKSTADRKPGPAPIPPPRDLPERKTT